MKLGSKLLSSFGKTDDIDDDMMVKAEEFLVRTISNDSSTSHTFLEFFSI